jgi:phospholipid-binding lipoprotein MlaA
VRLKLALLWLPVMLTGCATVSQENNFDPWEGMNRKVFAFNMTLDRYAIKPAARAYRWAIPAYIRARIRGIVTNLSEPLIFANDLLQGRVTAAGITLGRFLVNTTAGLAGMFDIASGEGMPRQSGDFGQTLYTWGVGDGPYLVLPLFGPSDLRDAFGFAADIYADPIRHLNVTDDNWQYIALGIGAVRAFDRREQNIESLDALEEHSLDFYAAMRSVYQQTRRKLLQEARPGPASPSEDLLDPGATPGSDSGPAPPDKGPPNPAPAPDARAGPGPDVPAGSGPVEAPGQGAAPVKPQP